MRIKAGVRALQVYFPWLLEVKCWLQRRVRLLFRRPFEPEFSAIRVLPPAQADQIYLDIGANRGQSIDAIRMLRPEAVIHAFEPNPLLVDRLQQTFSVGSRLVIHGFGLDNRVGGFSLHIPFYSGFMFDGLASFDRDKAAGWLPRHLPGFNPAKQEIRTVTCTVKPLDELDLAPCFIKIHVQGLEERVVRGGLATIRRHRPVLLIASPPDELAALLTAEGYERCVWNGKGFKRGGKGEYNTFFLTPEHLREVGA